MFALAVVILLSCCISQSMQCDLTKEHPVIDDTSNKTSHCMKCKTCKPGKELKIPCGTPVSMSEQVGDCTPCKNGTYSATEDSRECQICRSEKCFEHQVIEGTCLANRRDETYCIEKCVNGYVMNKEGTACEVLTPQQNTTEKPTNNLTTTNPTTSNPTTTNPTTGTTNPTTTNPTTMKPTTMKPTTLRNPKTKKLPTNNHAINTITTKKPVVSKERKGKNVPLIVVIVIAIVFFVIILAIVFKFVWPRLKILMQTREPQGGKCEDVELLDVSVEEREEPVKIIKQDSTQNASAHAGRDTTVIPNPAVLNIDNDTNLAYMSNIPPPRNDVVLEIPVPSPAQMAFGSLTQPQVMASGRQPPFNHLDPTSFDFYPLNLYKEICRTFDNGPPLKNAEALACWLGITVNENREFEKRENKTDLIIKSWMESRENTVAKFVEILNAHGMTRLVDEINAYRV